MRIFIVLALCAVVVSALLAIDPRSERIVDGSVTTIDNYPSLAGLLWTADGVNFRQVCGGSILNERSVLTATHCFGGDYPAIYRVRVGSTWANSGGVVHNLIRIILHPDYSIFTIHSDIAIVHTATFIIFNDVVQLAPIAGPNYVVPDNASVWAAGWGAISHNGPGSEQLRHVEMWNINADICRSFYPFFTHQMLCAGVLEVGGPAQCFGDSGGPLYHEGTVVGVCSFTSICGAPHSPSGNLKVSEYTAWIQANALT